MLEALKLVDPDFAVRHRLVDAAEYRVVLVQQSTQGGPGGLPWVEGRWLAHENRIPVRKDGSEALAEEPEAQLRFREDAEAGGWWTGLEDGAVVMAAVEAIAAQEKARRGDRSRGG